jgi:RNA polymerase sigma factor (sigma-70 family)
MEIYRKYGPLLLRKSERILGNRDDAEDVVQSLFVEMLRRDRTEEKLPYLYRAVTNRSLNLLRNRKRRRQLLVNQPLNPYPTQPIVDEQVLGSDLLHRLVKRLDRKSSEILVYRFLDDMTHEEIASLMGMSRVTVINRLKKITAIAKKLDGEGGQSGETP